MNAEVDENTLQEAAKQLPSPSGYRILCLIPPVEEKFAGSELVKPATTLTAEEFASLVLFVVELGPDCYADKIRFPSGPWCKKGDFVLTRAYSGTRLKIHGREFRLINDDSVEAVVQDPRGISRA